MIFVDCKLNVSRKMSKRLLELFGLSQSFSLVSMSPGVNRAVGKTFSGNNLCYFFYKDLRISITFLLQRARLYLSFVRTIPDNFCSSTKIIPNTEGFCSHIRTIILQRRKATPRRL